jgi:hypothetical protein
MALRLRASVSPIPFIAAAAAIAAATPALAQNDRIRDVPTAWAYLYGATSAQIADVIADGYRPFAIERAGSGYDTVFVHNSGDYQMQGASVVYGLTPTGLENYLNTNNRRILDLEVYDSSGTTLMTAITVPNSGGTATPAWGYVYNTNFASIVSWMNSNPSLRLIDLDVYTIGGTQYYSAVAVHNSGSNAQGWWYYSGITPQQINTELTNNDARLVSLAVVSPGTLLNPPTFACVMVSSNPGAGWWYYGLSTAQIADLLEHNGARITCLRRYTNFLGQTVWAVAMVDNVNAQTRRMRQYMAERVTTGSYGFMLKRVGGPVLAGLNTNFAFEPASMLKILHSAYAIDRCADGADSLTNLVFVDDTCNPNECPDTVQCSPMNLTLGEVIRRTMENSDNNCTFELETRYGRTALNNWAASLGLTSTRINHRLGCLCGEPFNTFSCADAVRFYELIADGALFPDAWRDQLFSRMLDLQNGNGWNLYPTLNAIITEEAANTNLTAGEIADFRSRVRFANKGGGYGCGSERWRTDGGWASLPFKVQLLNTWFISNREYTLAAFVHGGTDPGANAPYSAKEEILREQIREALQSWDAACSTPTFAAQPPNRTASLGGSVSFPATLGGAGNTTCQWQKRTGQIWSNLSNQAGHISGATTATLTISSIVAADAGEYRLIVTRDCGTATSAIATLTITGGCPADWNSDAVVNSSDISAFLTTWLQSVQGGALEADFNADLVVNSTDISAFLTAWLQAVQNGC